MIFIYATWYILEFHKAENCKTQLKIHLYQLSSIDGKISEILSFTTVHEVVYITQIPYAVLKLCLNEKFVTLKNTLSAIYRNVFKFFCYMLLFLKLAKNV